MSLVIAGTRVVQLFESSTAAADTRRVLEASTARMFSHGRVTSQIRPHSRFRRRSSCFPCHGNGLETSLDTSSTKLMTETRYWILLSAFNPKRDHGYKPAAEHVSFVTAMFHPIIHVADTPLLEPESLRFPVLFA